MVQAAERLEMGLPAASRLVSSLEKELGIELLDRKRKPAQIVTKSLELFSEADRIARQYQRLLKTVLMFPCVNWSRVFICLNKSSKF